jgi:hypothetical protein
MMELAMTVADIFTRASLGLLLAACQPAASNSPANEQPQTPAPEQPIASNEEPPATIVEPPPPAEPERWLFTTLVTGARPGYENLIGANGFYELTIDVDGKATIRKIGQTGTPKFTEDKHSVGSQFMSELDNAEWPNARHRNVAIDLDGPDGRRHLIFDLWFLGDEVHGSWGAPNQRDRSHIGSSWGLVQGRRAADDGDPLELRHGGDAPCMVCVRAFWNCDGLSWDDPVCNSAESARSKCNAQLENARASGSEVPRGCGDYMM